MSEDTKKQKIISQSAIAVWETTKNDFFNKQMLSTVDQLLEAHEKIKSLEEELEVEKQRFVALEERINSQT